MSSPQIRGEQIKDETIKNVDVADDAAIEESKIAFDPVDGHTHDGVDSAFVDGGIAFKGEVTVTLTGVNQDTWTGTQTVTGLTTSHKVNAGACFTVLDGTFIFTITDVQTDEFDWKLESFQGFSGGTVKVSYVVLS